MDFNMGNLSDYGWPNSSEAFLIPPPLPPLDIKLGEDCALRFCIQNGIPALSFAIGVFGAELLVNGSGISIIMPFENLEPLK